MTVIYDHLGNPIQSPQTEVTDPGLRGGWRYGTPGDGGNYQLQMTRQEQRRLCRKYFFTNSLFGMAVEMTAAFLLGDGFTFGRMHDRQAQEVLEDFWAVNDLQNFMTQRWLLEFLLDGENATLLSWEPGESSARLVSADVELGVSPVHDPVRGVTGVKVRRSDGSEEEFSTSTQAVWTANLALWNDPRGWPVVFRALDAARSYVDLLNYRLGAHKLQSRILGVYKAFVDPAGKGPDGKPDGGHNQWREKASFYRSLPENGGVLTLAMKVDPTLKSVVSEDITFPKATGNAGEGATDAKLFLRLVGLCMGGFPEHWFGEGGDVNRSTAGEMSTPAVKICLQRQAVIRNYLDRLLRLELKRRFGPDRKYKVQVVEPSADGLSQKKRTKMVLADRLEFPWVFPQINEDTLEQLVRKVEAALKHHLISPQTAAGELGFDPAEEVERMAAAGLVFGRGDVEAQQAVANGEDDGNPQNPKLKKKVKNVKPPAGEEDPSET